MAKQAQELPLKLPMPIKAMQIDICFFLSLAYHSNLRIKYEGILNKIREAYSLPYFVVYGYKTNLP